MSDWVFLNKHRVRVGPMRSDDSFGFNGMFFFWLDGQRIRVVASDGEGWEHVSVSLVDHHRTTPKWSVMCAIKELFWEDEDCVIQFHPPKSEYVNNHAGCLHLWRCTDGREQPRPPAEMVGVKGLQPA